MWTDADKPAFISHQSWAWRRMLQVGGRAPVDALAPLCRLDSCTIEWRVRRVAHLLRLVNSPPDSWQHVSLLSQFYDATPWLEETLCDLRLVLPTVRIWVETSMDGLPFLVSNGWWGDEGFWCGAQAAALPCDMLGRRCRTPMRFGVIPREVEGIKGHVRNISRALRAFLRREHDSNLLTRLRERNVINSFAKTALLSHRLCAPGPPMHVALDWVSSIRNRAALASLLTGDWFLGRYAGNFFAKSFLPDLVRDSAALAAARTESSRVCICCWHYRREVHEEDEAHVFISCPQYRLHRDKLRRSVSSALSRQIFGLPSAQDKLLGYLGSHMSEDWQAVGTYCGQVRQARRKLRSEFERLEALLKRCDFAAKRMAWRQRGLFVCRHGVFFVAAQGRNCPCMSAHASDDMAWQHARYMPALNEQLRKLIAVPFNAQQYVRLGVLQAQMRASRW